MLKLILRTAFVVKKSKLVWLLPRALIKQICFALIASEKVAG